MPVLFAAPLHLLQPVVLFLPDDERRARPPLLKAWNTGHPGGVATIHANSATEALQRIEDLVGEASQIIPKRSIASAINLVIFIERLAHAAGRTVSAISEVLGFDAGEYKMRAMLR